MNSKNSNLGQTRIQLVKKNLTGGNSNLSKLASRRGVLSWENGNFRSERFRVNLYRFLRDNIPLLNACIWTWSRLSSAPVKYVLTGDISEMEEERAANILDNLADKMYPYGIHKMAGLGSFLPFMFSSLYTDGAFAGFLILKADGSGVERFLPIDPAIISVSGAKNGQPKIILDTGTKQICPDGADFYYFGLNADTGGNIGKSILSSIPFVSYIQQQLIDDMRRTTHNAGYNRLHVKIKPPERQSGESDEAYVERINSYFDETVSMIKNCDPEDNPVTWDNVEIEHVGPGHSRAISNSWFMTHRAMVEEICAGTNLSPFMLGYSYGTTHNWAQFKYDLVMRQVHSVQRQAARFLEWIGNIELALHGISAECKYVFSNEFSYLAPEKVSIEKTKTENLLALFHAGLISKEIAEKKAGELI